MKKHKIVCNMLMLFSVLFFSIFVFNVTSEGKPIVSNLHISQDFESYTPASYAGGSGLQAAIKPTTGGSQSIVQQDDKKLKISVKYISDASAHDSFVQMSNPMVIEDRFISSFDVCVPDSTKGSFNVEMTCGSSYIFPLIISKGKISYPDSTTQDYIDGNTVTFSIVLCSDTNELRIYKNNAIAYVSHNIKSDFPKCNFSSVRLRYTATSWINATDKYDVYIDNIYIAGGNNESDLYVGNSQFKRHTNIENTDISLLKEGSFSYMLPVGYSGSVIKNVSFILAHYSKDDDALSKALKDIEFFEVNLKPGFQKVIVPFDITNFNSSDTYEIYFMPEGEYDMLFQRVSESGFTKLNNHSGEKMVGAITNAHPRIWLSGEKITEIKELIKTDSVVNTWYQSIKTDANKLLTDPLPVYEDDDPQRLACSQKVVASVPLLSLMYLLDGNEEYAYRAYEYMMAVCEFEDWAPYHFLDTSNITIAVSIGYDWLYNYFVNRKISLEYFEDKIASMGLSMGRDAYLKKLYTGNYWWVDGTTNWNVCCNCGMTIGALAIGDVERHSLLSAFVLETALESLERMLPRFAPDGAWFEGPSYWGSTTAPLTNMTYALQTSLGSDYGILSFEGISNTAYYPIINTGRKIAFNLHDASESSVDAPQYWYFASVYNDKNIAGYRYRQLTERGAKPSYKDILWYDKNLIEEDFDKYIKKDDYFRDIEVAVFRNTYKGDDINFFGIHGGSNSVEHGQLDVGSFVYEALGERWAVDLGGEAYNMHNYWIMDDIEKSRWGYYRSRAEGHNTIVINPGSLADQDLDCMAKITDFSSSDTQGTATVDISGAYKKYASSATRSAVFDKVSGKLEICDNVKLKGTFDVYWFMHTKAEISLSDDCKTATLTQNGKSIRVLCDGDGTFSVMNAVPLSSSPNPDEWPENIANDGSSRAPTHQNKNEGVRKLVISLEDASGNIKFNVKMTPLG